MTVNKCVSCGSDLPSGRRSDRRYCGGRCRVRAHRIRTGEGKHVRPTRKHGHTALKAALGTIAAATAAAVAVELVRNSQDARLAEHQRRIAELEEGLRKSQAEKEELKRAKEDLQSKVEQVTREKIEKEEQLCRNRKELGTDKETEKTLRSALDRALLERSHDQQRLLEVRRERDEAENLQQEIATEYGRLRFESHRQIDDLLEYTDKLGRQLAVAKDKQSAQITKQSTSYRCVQLQSKLENAQAEIKTLKQNVRALEKSLSSPARRLSARAQPKMLPAVSNNTESIRLKGELAQAKAEIRLLKGQVEARQALPASSAQTSLAVANRSIEHLNSENRRLSKECMEAIELARQWEDYSRRLARQVGGQSTLQEQTEGGKPGFLKSALTAIGMIGSGVVLGAGAAAMLGREDSPKSLGAAPEQKALGPRPQRLLPPKSNS